MAAELCLKNVLESGRVQRGPLATLNELLPGNDSGCSTSLYLGLIEHPGFYVNLPELGF